jgi:hypothetical protein
VSNTGSQDKELDEGNHHCLICYKPKAQARQQLMGSYHHREAIQLAQTMLNSSDYNWEAAVTSMKHHLRRTLGSHIATNEEVSSLLALHSPLPGNSG